MTELRSMRPPGDGPSTEAGKFLAKRGHVVMKQFRDIGTVKGEYSTKLRFSTLIFAIAQGSKGERTFGLKIEHESQDGMEETCLVDFDELKELLYAIKHLFEFAKQASSERTDYTEFQYITRDSLKVGFYQDANGTQQAFFDVAPGGSVTFISFESLRSIFGMISKGRDYLMQKGAGVDAVISQ